MNNPVTILSFLGSMAVVLIVAILYFLASSPKPPILQILLIIFAAAAVLGILTGIIAPLIKNKNMTTTRLTDLHLSPPRSPFGHLGGDA